MGNLLKRYTRADAQFVTFNTECEFKTSGTDMIFKFRVPFKHIRLSNDRYLWWEGSGFKIQMSQPAYEQFANEADDGAIFPNCTQMSRDDFVLAPVALKNHKYIDELIQSLNDDIGQPLDSPDPDLERDNLQVAFAVHGIFKSIQDLWSEHSEHIIFDGPRSSQDQSQNQPSSFAENVTKLYSALSAKIDNQHARLQYLQGVEAEKRQIKREHDTLVDTNAELARNHNVALSAAQNATTVALDKVKKHKECLAMMQMTNALLSAQKSELLEQNTRLSTNVVTFDDLRGIAEKCKCQIKDECRDTKQLLELLKKEITDLTARNRDLNAANHTLHRDNNRLLVEQGGLKQKANTYDRISKMELQCTKENPNPEWRLKRFILQYLTDGDQWEKEKAELKETIDHQHRKIESMSHSKKSKPKRGHGKAQVRSLS